MQTLQPEAYIFDSIPCESHSKNVRLYRYGKHRMVVLILDQFFADFPSCELLFELVKTLQTEIQLHF